MKKIILGMILSGFVATASYAASVDTFGIGPKATALGGAVTAQSNDVFSIYYNPAGLSQLKGGQLSVALQICDPALQFHDYTVTDGSDPSIYGTPTNIKDDSDLLYVPFLGYAQPINDKISLGVAAYVPFGLDVEWKDDTAASLNWFHSYYLREVITPTLSYKISDTLAVGVGVSIGKSKSGAEKVFNYPVAASTAMGLDPSFDTFSEANQTAVYTNTYASVIGAGGDAATATTAATTAATTYTALSLTHAVHGQKLELELEDSFNYSMNVGLQYTPNDKVAVGLSYRGRAEADFDGDVTIGGIKVATADMSYDHPEQVQVGVMVRPVPSVTLEMDVVWTNWSINDTQYTEFSTPLLGLLPSETLERNWNDTNQIRLGAEWQVNETVALRCGYFYDPTPIPDDTFDIMWPDADRKTYSIGTGLNFGAWTLDASLQLAHAETKRIIGGESDNINHPYNPPGITGYRVETSADGYLLGYGLALTYNF
jgi:long-chain fatty acid transport protein